MNFKLFLSIGLALATPAQAADPFGAATPTPYRPYRNSVLYSNPRTWQDLHDLRTGPAGSDVYLHSAVAVARRPFYARTDLLDLEARMDRVVLEAAPRSHAEICSTAWFASDACLLQLAGPSDEVTDFLYSTRPRR
jgi:hypothetical protein